MDLMAHHSTDKFNALNGRDKRLFFITIKMLEQQKWMSDNNVHSCKDRIISIFQPLGRPPKENKTDDYEEKMVRYSGERNEIETTFGTGKRVYKANNIRGKLADTGATWTAACHFAKNVMKFLRNLLHALLLLLDFRSVFSTKRLSYENHTILA